jgi:hypothetical protein
MAQPEISNEAPEFSLVLGGPLFDFFRRARLSGHTLEFARRRVVVIVGVAWLPLLLLALIGGHAIGGPLQIPFLYDIEAQVRFLIALPILIVAEVIVHSRLVHTVRRFVERRLIVSEDMTKFHAAIDSAMRIRNSLAVELTLLLLVYTLGLWLWRSQIATGSPSWYAKSEGTALHLTLAGYWYAFVSIPIFQFMLVRWYLRFFIWFQFLWRVSKLNLRLIATHPDRAAGIGFLGQSAYAFGPILFAQGTMLAGLIANRILHGGENLMAFKMELAGLVAFMILLVFSPLLSFNPLLSRVKREGLRAYGRLGSRYVEAFEEKWIRGAAPNDEELLGSADIQSLTDLGNSFAVVQEMRVVPFSFKDLVRLAAITAAPLLPLTLTVFSLEELVTRVIKILF